MWITIIIEKYIGCKRYGILINHGSPRRVETYVIRKITKAVARIVKNMQDCLCLGNLNSLRDWGHVKDYKEAMWLIWQQDIPENYVIATGENTFVRDFLEWHLM